MQMQNNIKKRKEMKMRGKLQKEGNIDMKYLNLNEKGKDWWHW